MHAGTGQPIDSYDAMRLRRLTGRRLPPAPRAAKQRLAIEDSEEYPTVEGVLENEASDERYNGEELVRVYGTREADDCS